MSKNEEKSTVDRIKELKREGKEDDGAIDFKVYNMPPNLVQKYISMAKLYYDNDVWKVLKKGMKLMMEEETSWRERMEQKIKDLEERMNELDSVQVSNEEETPTFGEEEGGEKNE